jgi:hypothetical protein
MIRRLGALVAVSVAVAGCGGDTDPSARKPATASTTVATASTAVPDCGEGVRSHAIRFRPSDGLSLSGAIVGSGPVGAVLIHESGAVPE